MYISPSVDTWGKLQIFVHAHLQEYNVRLGTFPRFTTANGKTLSFRLHDVIRFIQAL